MTLNPNQLLVDAGPSLRDIELSLTDGAMGQRTVRFHFTEAVQSRTFKDAFLILQVNGLERIGQNYEHWKIRGVADTLLGRRVVFIEYNTKTRVGAVDLEGDFQLKVAPLHENLQSDNSQRMPSL